MMEQIEYLNDMDLFSIGNSLYVTFFMAAFVLFVTFYSMFIVRKIVSVFRDSKYQKYKAQLRAIEHTYMKRFV